MILYKPFCRNYLCTKVLYYLASLQKKKKKKKKIEIVNLSHSNMAKIYVQFDRLGCLDAGFQQVPLVQNFWNIDNIVMEHQ